MELTQTLNQKETAQLMTDFFSELTKSESKRDEHLQAKHIYESTGIKLSKPFFMDIHEGSFTTNALLKKYPLSTNQVMFIVVLYKKINYWSELEELEHTITRVYDTGKIYTHTKSWKSSFDRSEHYLSSGLLGIPNSMADFNDQRKKAHKTLVIVADSNNMITNEDRKNKYDLESETLDMLEYNPASARVHIIEDNPNYFKVTLRGSNIQNPYTMPIYKNALFSTIDPSGYVVEFFRDKLNDRLEQHYEYLGVKKVATTDYSQPLQKVYDEMTVLKNLLATTLISVTDIDIMNKLSKLIQSVTVAFSDYAYIEERLNRTVTCYNKNETRDDWYGIFLSDNDVTWRLSDLEEELSDIRERLFDYLQQADI